LLLVADEQARERRGEARVDQCEVTDDQQEREEGRTGRVEVAYLAGGGEAGGGGGGQRGVWRQRRPPSPEAEKEVPGGGRSIARVRAYRTR
jgi:hypothetical protein